MSSDFDPSPRASKRRKTTKYNGSRTILIDSEAAGKELANSVPESEGGLNGDMIAVDATTTKADESTPARKPVARKHGSGSSSKRNRAASGGKTSTAAAGDVQARPDEESEMPSTHARALLKGEVGNAGEVMDTTRRNGVGVDGHGNSDEEQDAGKVEGVETTPRLRSSSRQRRAPQRLEDTLSNHATPKRAKKSQLQQEIDESAPASPVLKGILTPSKTQRTRPRKSVMFQHDNKQIEEQFGFRDIDTPAKSTSTRKVTPHPRKAKQVNQVPTVELEDEGVIDVAIEDDMLDEPTIDVPVPEVSRTVESIDLPPSKDDPHLYRIRSSVLSRLTSASLPLQPPEHLQSQYSQLYSLLRATIASSESNSILLLGPRGAGKSTLISLALRDLSETHKNHFHTVHLSGFLQTDDRLALREIWRQLGQDRGLHETETEDIGASYADTMSSLLSLLSHPDEMQLDQDGQVNGQGQTTSKSIVFILDEFDLFTTHPRQTLLYNLFDIAQSRKAPIAVVGCSTRMDVIECLEKRVKSRFSHRWVLVPGCRTLGEWEACVRGALIAEEDDATVVRSSDAEETATKRWNGYIKETFLRSARVQRLVKSHFYTSKSLPDMLMALFPMIAALQVPSSPASADGTGIAMASAVLKSPSILEAIPTLPVLHLSLLTASCRLTTIYHLPTPNFNLVHAHYTELVASMRLKQSAGGAIATSGSLRQWNREICRGAWEELAGWGLLVPVAGGGEDGSGRGGIGGEGEEDTRMWRAEVGLEDVEWALREKFGIEGDGRGSGGAGQVLLRWCREV